jgi:signal transduction histidine kinase
MHTRTRLLLGFVIVNLLLSVVMGIVAWTWLDQSMRAQAEESARSVGRVLAQGGFPLTDEVMAKMRELTGYQFRILPAKEFVRSGTVQVAEAGKVVEVDYQTAAYLKTSHAVLVGSMVMIVIGSLLFWIVARWLALQVARPIEQLAGSARIIGTGNWEQAVAQVGSGELKQLAMELEHMRCRLRDMDRQHRQDERLSTLGTFTATIAHEVRNPLSAVRLTIQMLARRLSPDGQDPAAHIIIEELDRLDLIIDELLAFSKGMSVTTTVCSLRQVVDDTVRLFRRQAEHAGVAVVVSSTSGVSSEAVVIADPARLRQLIMNVLLNAIQAVQANAVADVAGQVDIVINHDGFSINDNGPGINPEMLPTLFEPFITGKPLGTGLGLHLAKAIAEAHGAKLAVDPRVKTGACFILSGLRSG